MTEPSFDRVLGELLAPEISELIQERRTHDARAALKELLPPEIADVLIAMPKDQRAVAFRLLARDTAAEVFTYLDPEQQEQLLDELNNDLLAAIFDEMAPDDRAEVFEEMPASLVTELMRRMRPEERRRTRVILGFPEESVGREMTQEFLTVKPEWTVEQALEHIRTYGDEAETVHTLYVVDDRKRLVDVIALRNLVTADPQTRCEKLREGHAVSLRATEDRERAVHVMQKYDLPVLPVVDRDGVLLGIVTFDDVAEVAEEEVTEDMHKMGGMEALDAPYRSTGVVQLVQKRVIWLLVLFFGGMLTVSAMGAFEESIERYAVLALFVPLIIASGGNSGAQAATLMIRSLAIGEITLADWWFVFRREILSGLMLGSALGLCGLFAGAATASLMNATDASAWVYGFAIGTAVVGVVIIGTITGSMLPFLLKRIGLDEATSSTPFVATIVDVAGLIIYFVVANLVLGWATG